MNESVKCDSH